MIWSMELISLEKAFREKKNFFRSLRESVAAVRREESGQEEDSNLQMQPQSYFQPGFHHL